MVLYLIGLGLGDEKDITVKGLEVVRQCAAVFLEAYTSVLGIDKQRLASCNRTCNDNAVDALVMQWLSMRLVASCMGFASSAWQEEFYGVSITEADRNTVESEAQSIYERSKDEDIAFLVVGDPLCATTHTDLIIRAKNVGAEVRVIHNASVMGAVASCGLQLYNFGQTVSIPLFEGDWRPTSFLPKLQYNRQGGMHTLCLLDIKVKEPDFDALAKGKLKYLPPRFMTVNVAIRQLLEADPSLASCSGVGMARLGQPSQTIVYGTLEELKYVDFGAPLHCLALCGDVHPLEEEVLQFFHVSKLPEEARTAGRHLYEEEEGRGSEASQSSEPPY